MGPQMHVHASCGDSKHVACYRMQYQYSRGFCLWYIKSDDRIGHIPFVSPSDMAYGPQVTFTTVLVQTPVGAGKWGKCEGAAVPKDHPTPVPDYLDYSIATYYGCFYSTDPNVTPSCWTDQLYSETGTCGQWFVRVFYIQRLITEYYEMWR